MYRYTGEPSLDLLLEFPSLPTLDLLTLNDGVPTSHNMESAHQRKSTRRHESKPASVSIIPGAKKPKTHHSKMPSTTAPCAIAQTLPTHIRSVTYIAVAMELAAQSNAIEPSTHAIVLAQFHLDSG
jgi:type VI protein secretion system component VasA